LALCHSATIVFRLNAGSRDNFEAIILRNRQYPAPRSSGGGDSHVSINYSEELLILVQMLVAIALGGIMGWERQSTGKWAGFRTYMLVCLSAMLFVRLGLVLIGDAAARFPSGALRADPTCTIEALAVGISFIGAGTIFRDRGGTVMLGLTTAAGLLVAASIGIAVAINRYIVACGITLISLFILRTLSHVEKRSKLNQ
jgi:putative Mg2+ transporter-C (MgtC) family protein